MSTLTLIEKMKTTIQRHGMLCGARCVLIAVSGGPDSLALLHLLRAISRDDYPEIILHAGHLHHGMRGTAADADAAFVRSECERLRVPCAVERVNVPLMASESGIGEEEAGRNARYAFLTRLARSIDADRIALGHHADDQAETVLMRVMRGAGPRGMCAIPYVRHAAVGSDIRIVRPLLNCSRSEIEAFVRLHGLRPRLDATNLSRKHLRNRLRHAILPAIQARWGSGLCKDLHRLAVQAGRLRCRLRDILHRMESRWPVSVEKEYVEADASWLKTMPPSIVSELVQHWMRVAGLWQRTPGRAHYGAILRLLREGSGAVALPGGVEACCSEGRFALRRPAGEAMGLFIMPLKVPGSTDIECLGARIEATVIEYGDDALNKLCAGDACEEILDFDKIAFPLHVRFRRPGDRMRPLGAPGTRRLKKIMMELRIPAWKRDRTPLVTMRYEPIWIVKHRIADVVRVDAGTRRMLRLRFIDARTEGRVAEG